MRSRIHVQTTIKMDSGSRLRLVRNDVPSPSVHAYERRDAPLVSGKRFGDLEARRERKRDVFLDVRIAHVFLDRHPLNDAHSAEQLDALLGEALHGGPGE